MHGTSNLLQIICIPLVPVIVPMHSMHVTRHVHFSCSEHEHKNCIVELLVFMHMSINIM